MSPNFLCIGAPKAGTTWLFDNLRRHPQVWLPKYKSVQYFSGKAAAARRKKLRRQWRSDVFREMSLRQSLWDLRYFFHPRLDDRWYASLFEPGRGRRAVGEIAPSYSAMDEQQIERARRLAPQAKIVFLLRNPVERMWSHAMLTVVRNTGRRIDQVSEEELRRFLASDATAKRSDYLRTYRLWSLAYGPERVFVGFFEEIARSPDRLLTSICEFLDIDADVDCFASTRDRNIFKGLGCAMPPRLEQELYQEHLEQLEGLAARFGGPAREWLEEAQERLESGGWRAA